MSRASHIIARLRREAQDVLPASLRTLPSGRYGTVCELVGSLLITPVDPAHVISRCHPERSEGSAPRCHPERSEGSAPRCHPERSEGSAPPAVGAGPSVAPLPRGRQTDWEFTTRTTFTSPETFVVELPHGRALDHAILTADGTLLSDLSIEPGVLPENAAEHSALRRRTLPALERIDGELTALVAYGGAHNYYHWMFDVLPRVGILEHAGRRPWENTKVLVDSTALPFHRETLATLGITNILSAAEHPYVRADTLIVPSLPGIMGDPTEKSVEFLRQRFGVSTSGQTRKLFISRASATSRRLLNERELVEKLAQLGFESVTLEGMAVPRQAELFASASVVIAPHGAGLANIVFCEPGMRVIELFSPTYVNGCYWALANLIGADYSYVLGEGTRPESDATHSGAADDYVVDVSSVLGLLR